MKYKRHNLLITLSPGVSITLSCDDLLWQMMPHSKRGDAQKFVRTSIVELHQAHFSHMRLTLEEYVKDLCERYNTKPASVIATSIAWHAGKHSKQ